VALGPRLRGDERKYGRVPHAVQFVGWVDARASGRKPIAAATDNDGFRWRSTHPTALPSTPHRHIVAITVFFPVARAQQTPAPAQV